MFSLNMVLFPACSLPPKLANLIPGYWVLPSPFTTSGLLLKTSQLFGKTVRKLILSLLTSLLKSLQFLFAPDWHELVGCIPGQDNSPVSGRMYILSVDL